jgi:hypothetical protein
LGISSVVMCDAAVVAFCLVKKRYKFGGQNIT